MNLRGSGGKATTVAIALGVAAAEAGSIVYFMFAPWFLQPDARGLYASIACNTVMFLILNDIVGKFWPLRKVQDAVLLSLRITTLYILIQAPYLITWYNPMTYTYLIGPFAHTFVQLAAMTGCMWYIKNQK